MTSDLRLLADSVTSSEDKDDDVDESSSEESKPSNEISTSNENTACKMRFIQYVLFHI